MKTYIELTIKFTDRKSVLFFKTTSAMNRFVSKFILDSIERVAPQYWYCWQYAVIADLKDLAKDGVFPTAIDIFNSLSNHNILVKEIQF